MAKFIFTINDNSGKKHIYTIKATDKQAAIEKGFRKANKNKKGDLYPNFECRLINY